MLPNKKASKLSPYSYSVFDVRLRLGVRLRTDAAIAQKINFKLYPLKNASADMLLLSADYSYSSSYHLQCTCLPYSLTGL